MPVAARVSSDPHDPAPQGVTPGDFDAFFARIATLPPDALRAMLSDRVERTLWRIDYHTRGMRKPDAAVGRGVRVQFDPDKYVRPVKGGRFQARPYCEEDGTRHNLGLFATRHQARKAVEEFWWGRVKPRPRFVRRYALRGGAVVHRYMLQIQIGGGYESEAECKEQGDAWVRETFGSDAEKILNPKEV